MKCVLHIDFMLQEDEQYTNFICLQLMDTFSLRNWDKDHCAQVVLLMYNFIPKHESEG